MKNLSTIPNLFWWKKFEIITFLTQIRLFSLKMFNSFLIVIAWWSGKASRLVLWEGGSDLHENTPDMAVYMPELAESAPWRLHDEEGYNGQYTTEVL